MPLTCCGEARPPRAVSVLLKHSKTRELTFAVWGTHTASIDWCELNYFHSPYLAEFFNTITNLPTISWGLYGAASCLANGLPKRYAITYLGLTLIGIGSFGFHASLKWEWQLLDELPMIYVVSYAALMTMDTKPGFEFRWGWWGPALVISWCIAVTTSYLYIPNPVYHEIAFAAILLSTVVRNAVLIRRLPKDSPARNLITQTLATGVVVFALGFAIWNVDNLLCSRLRSARSVMGIWGGLLECHAHWHLMTGYGSYLILTAATYLQLCHKVSPQAYSYSRSSWLPIVRPVVSPADPKPVPKAAKSSSSKGRLEDGTSEKILANGNHKKQDP